MAKKDFTVNSAIAQATATAKTRKPRKEYTEEERKAYINERKTSGRKGVKMPRINCAFTPEAHEYIKIMARVSGQSLTNFIELCVREHKLQHLEQFEQAQKLIDSL